MVFDPGNLLAIGFVKRPHGFKGKVRIILYEEYELNNKEPAFFEFQGKPVPFFIDSIEGDSAEPVVLFDEFDSEEDALTLKGREIFIKTDKKKQNKGLSGWNLLFQNNLIGSVLSVIDREQQPLLEVEYQDRKILIPLVDDWVISMNENQQIIEMDFPSELLEL